VKDRLELIREFQEADEADVVGVWHRSGKAAYSYLPAWQTLTLHDARTFFRDSILRHCGVWVGTLDADIVAFLAMNGSYVDRMYVDPLEWCKGWGARLLAFAKALHPAGLELHTHQENRAARRLYEKHGFKAVRFGLSPPPECVPDVEYHWRP
jgi:GNAT superfamily N-acetyltransferase